MAHALVRKGIAAVLAAGALLLMAAPLQAGPIFIAGQLDGDKFTPAKDAGAPWYCVRYSSTVVTVEDAAARVQVAEVIDGPDKAVQAICLIPLPQEVDRTDV